MSSPGLKTKNKKQKQKTHTHTQNKTKTNKLKRNSFTLLRCQKLINFCEATLKLKKKGEILRKTKRQKRDFNFVFLYLEYFQARYTNLELFVLQLTFIKTAHGFHSHRAVFHKVSIMLRCNFSILNVTSFHANESNVTFLTLSAILMCSFNSLLKRSIHFK